METLQTIEIIFEMDLWEMLCCVPNSIQLLLRPISNLMTHFAEETNFLEDLSDLLTKSGTLATSDQCQTHPHNLIKSNFSRHISRRNTISPKFSSSIVQSHIDKVTVGYSSDVAEVTFETSQLLPCHYQSLNILNATCQYPSSSSSKLCL